MDKESLISAMQMQYKTTKQYLEILQTVVAENPWFAIGRQLLTIEQQELDQNFDENISKTAIYCINRNILFEKIYCKNRQNRQKDFTISTENGEPDSFEYSITDYFFNEKIEISDKSDNNVDKFLAAPQKTFQGIKTYSINIDETADTTVIPNDDVITETMAKIYSEQGYISKSIAIYEKLSLLDSKKNIYFATLIENLKKKNKNS